jgi:ornithine--oxo-acid transaminase
VTALSDSLLALEEAHGARNYHPLPVVLTQGEGVWVDDVEGRRYFDALSGYSALNFGHRHPRLIAAAHEQLDRLTLTSRAFHTDQLGPFCAAVAELCGKERVLPMNTGAEGVETAIKLARRWGYERKGIEPDRARIVVCRNNFHGRTTTVISFSNDPAAHDGFGPYMPGFDPIPFGDAGALRDAITPDTAAFLVEPVQGEAGVIVPPPGYLTEVREVCSEAGILMVADEVQTGLGRTGRNLACEHEGVVPDAFILGKALGGGVLPVSAVVADADVLDVIRPGEHGSTFGGNPLSCAVGREAVSLVADGTLAAESGRLGTEVADQLRREQFAAVPDIRQIGLWIGIDIDPVAATGRAVCERLLEAGVLCKDTQQQTIRIGPPLVATREELDWALERIVPVLRGLA